MPAKSDEFLKQVNDLWKQAVTQLEEVKDAFSARVEGRLESDLYRLKLERDRLLLRLGEQTYKLANQGSLPMPTIVRRTVDRINEVIDSMVETQSGKKASKKKTTKKKTTKKKASKKKPAASGTRKKSTTKRKKTGDKASQKA